MFSTASMAMMKYRLPETSRLSPNRKKSEEKIYSPKDTGLNHVKPYDIFGGNSVEEATSIFTALLEGKGTREQVDVASINAAFALKCLHPEISLGDCISTSKESLASGKALQSLKSLISLQ